MCPWRKECSSSKHAATARRERAGLRGGQQQVRIGRYVLPIGGDILTAIDGEPIRPATDLIRFLDTKTEVGQTIQVTIWRDGAGA